PACNPPATGSPRQPCKSRPPRRSLDRPLNCGAVVWTRFEEEFRVPRSVLAVVSVLGKDQKGVVAQFATYMAERGINIQDIEQRVVRGFFLMDMLVDLADLTSSLSELIPGLIELGRRIDMEVRVHLHSQRKKKKIALLV